MQMKGLTHSFCNIHERWENFLALLASYVNFSHIQNTESCATKLRPDFAPAAVFMRFVVIWVSVQLVNEWAREIDLLHVRRS